MTDTPGTDVAVPTRMDPGSIAARKEYASLLADSTLVPAAYRGKPANVFLAVEYGGMLGVHPLAALSGIHVIEGKPTLSPALMTALVRGAGHKVRTGTTGKVTDGTIEAWCEIVRSDDPDHPFRATWDLERAERAKLVTVVRAADGTVTLTGKQTWTSYTEAMLKARAQGEACREAAEEVLMGAHYTPEELGAVVGEDGEVIDGEIVTDPPAAQQPPTAPQEPAPAPATDHPTPAEGAAQAPVQSPERGNGLTEQELAAIAVRGIDASRNPDDLTGVYHRLEATFAEQPWASGYTSFAQWLRATPAPGGTSMHTRFADRMTDLKADATVAQHDAVKAAQEVEQVDPWADGSDPAGDPPGDVVDAEVVEDTRPLSPRQVAQQLGVTSAPIVEHVDPEDRRAELARESGVTTDEPAPPPLAGENSTARETARRIAREAAEKSRQENENR